MVKLFQKEIKMKEIIEFGISYLIGFLVARKENKK